VAGLVVAFEVPHFLVPSPLRVAQVLVSDAALLFGALVTTLKITCWPSPVPPWSAC
jgi:NitT/TauT family transport system permease protein